MYDVVIIGTGPAGYTAAIYNARAFLKVLMLSGPQLGGQLTITTEVENYPGFSSVAGPQLVEDMKKQAERFGTEIKLETVLNVKCQMSDVKTEETEKFVVKTEKAEYEGRTVIVATGANAKYLGLPSEEKLKGHGVSACATCDGFFYRGKEVVVIGGGDTAMEEATFLTKFATHVTIINRSDTYRASPIMLKRAQDNPKISFITNKTVEEVLGTEKVTGVRLKDVKTNETSEIKTDGFFLAIGHEPATKFLQGTIELDQKGYIVMKKTASSLEAQTQTSVPGIFAAGDCVDPRYKQAIVAAGMGCMAAIDAQRYLEEKNS